jgi:hypothetical protein
MSLFGFEAKAYRNTGTYVSPTWNLMERVQDLTLDLTAAEVETTTREDEGWETAEPGFLRAEVEFTIRADTTDADWNALHDAFIARTAIEFAIMNQAIATSGAEGLRARCHVFQGGRDEAMAGKQMTTFRLRPAPKHADYAIPAWHVV